MRTDFPLGGLIDPPCSDSSVESANGVCIRKGVGTGINLGFPNRDSQDSRCRFAFFRRQRKRVIGMPELMKKGEAGVSGVQIEPYRCSADAPIRFRADSTNALHDC